MANSQRLKLPAPGSGCPDPMASFAFCRVDGGPSAEFFELIEVIREERMKL